MGSLLATLLPLALGVAVSPLGIIAVIVVLFTARPVRNGLCFLVGWVAAIVAIFAVTIAIASGLHVSKPSQPPGWVAGVHIAVGGVLLVTAAWMYWRGKERVRRIAQARRPGEVVQAAPRLPNWLRSIPTYRSARCFMLGLALCAINPVDASCVIGAAVDVRVCDASSAAKVVCCVVFLLIAIVTIAAPIGYVAVRGASSVVLLDRARTWLGEHNGIITVVFFAAIGVLQLVEGVRQL